MSREGVLIIHQQQTVLMKWLAMKAGQLGYLRYFPEFYTKE